jgi:hypothetical protein
MAGFDTRSRAAWKEERGKLSSIVVASSERTARLCAFQAERLRRMQEELHDVGIPGSTPGCAQLAQWSNGRTPMRRFSTDRRRRQGYL